MKYKSKYRPMSGRDRAAQFAPFAALSGYEKMIEEILRPLEEWKELSPDQEKDLNEKLNQLLHIKNKKPEIEIEYFAPDPKKEEGRYKKERINFKDYDVNEEIILSKDLKKYPIKLIRKIRIINEGD